MEILVSGKELLFFTAVVASASSYISTREMVVDEVQGISAVAPGEKVEVPSADLAAGQAVARSVTTAIRKVVGSERRVPTHAQLVDEEEQQGEERQRWAPRPRTYRLSRY